MRRRSSRPLMLLLLLGYAFPAGAQQQGCRPAWSADFAYVGVQDTTAAAWFDADAGGPQPATLVVSGNFQSLGGVTARNIAAWDGARWGPLSTGLAGAAHALVVFDDDGGGPTPPALYAAGYFEEAGGGPASRVARWDGHNWSELSGGTDGPVLALAEYDPDGAGGSAPVLAAGGYFTQAGESPASNVAIWDGQTWSALGEGVKHVPGQWINAIRQFDHDRDGVPSLFVGGNFTTAGGKSATGVAMWEDGAWGAAGDPLIEKPSVYALEVADTGPTGPALFIGGVFTKTASHTLNNVARLQDGQWLPLGGGITPDAWVVQLRSFDSDGEGPLPGRLIAGGQFSTADSRPVNKLAAWDGAEWSALTPEIESESNPWITTLSVVPGPLGDLAGPLLAIGGGIAHSECNVEALALWDGHRMLRIGRGLVTEGGALNGSARQAAVFDPDGDGPRPSMMAVVGGFVGHVAAFEGGHSGWLGAGVRGDSWFNLICYPTSARAAGAWDPDGPGPQPSTLFVSGEFTLIADLAQEHRIAAWNPETGWESLGDGPSPIAAALLGMDVDGPGPEPTALYAAGKFVPGNISRWDGQTWAVVGKGLGGGEARCLAEYDIDGGGPLPASLIVGGSFTLAGGAEAPGIVRWDGQQWHPIGEGAPSAIRDLAIWDRDGGGAEPALLVAAATPVSAWDGQVWTDLGKACGEVKAAAALDEDGPGPSAAALFIGGNIDCVDGVAVDNIARFDGVEWTALGAGIAGEGDIMPPERGVNDLAVLDDDGDGPMLPALYAMGFFRQAGGQSADLLARWGCEEICLADCDGSGDLDLFDFLCFVNLYNTNDPDADCTGEGEFDFFDFVCFINLFSEGC